MLKHSLLVLVAVGAVSVAVPFAAAQDSPPADQQSQPSQEHGGWHRGQQRSRPAHPGTDPNSSSSRPISKPKCWMPLQSAHTQMESLRQDTSLSQQDRRAKMMDIHKNTDSQIRGLLDSNQQKKWDEMQGQA